MKQSIFNIDVFVHQGSVGNEFILGPPLRSLRVPLKKKNCFGRGYVWVRVWRVGGGQYNLSAPNRVILRLP